MRDNGAIALVEPFRLHARLSGRGRAAFNAPLEHAHGIGQRALLGLLTQFLVHGIARRRTAQMRQARARDQAMRRIRMMQWRSHTPGASSCRIVEPPCARRGGGLLLERHAGVDGPRRQLPGASHAIENAHAQARFVDHTNAQSDRLRSPAGSIASRSLKSRLRNHSRSGAAQLANVSASRHPRRIPAQ